jgi:hypothetical protein
MGGVSKLIDAFLLPINQSSTCKIYSEVNNKVWYGTQTALHTLARQRSGNSLV